MGVRNAKLEDRSRKIETQKSKLENRLENEALDSECGARPFTRGADCVPEKKKREQAPAVQTQFLTRGMIAEEVG